MLDLQEFFRTLVLPAPDPDRASYAAIPIPGSPHRLAKDSAGAPCLLVVQRSDERSAPPIVLENLTVRYDVECKVRRPNGAHEEGRFTILSCATTDPSLFPHFLTVLSPLVASLGPTPTGAAVRRMISSLVELFRAIAAPGKKVIQGLWAELFLIRNAQDCSAMARAWHRSAGERFDFAAGSQRLEVKSSSSRHRQHQFSLHQLKPPQGTQLVVGSLFVERSGGGLTLGRIFRDIRGGLPDAEAIAAFDATFYSSLGSAFSTAMSESYDEELARESVRYYSAESIPTLTQPIPSSISDVRFAADLSSVAPLTDEELATRGDLFAAVGRAK